MAVLYQSLVSISKANHFHIVVIMGGSDYRPDNRIQSRAIAAAGQNAKSSGLRSHIIVVYTFKGPKNKYLPLGLFPYLKTVSAIMTDD